MCYKCFSDAKKKPNYSLQSVAEMDSRPAGRGGGVPVKPWSVATSMVIYIILLSGVATTQQLDFVSLGNYKGGRQKLLGGFFQLRGYPPLIAK